MSTRKCPYCAEEIQAEAVICKHCQSRVEPIPLAESTATPDPSKPAAGETPRGCLWLILVVVALFIAVAIVDSLNSGDSDDTIPGPEKYNQTWGKAYSSTTCVEWNGAMKPEQKFAAAADMLTGARNKGDGGKGLPSDELVDEFSAGIDTACVEPTATLADIGAALYLTERERFRP